jgi:hypothetical protein
VISKFAGHNISKDRGYLDILIFFRPFDLPHCMIFYGGSIVPLYHGRRGISIAPMAYATAAEAVSKSAVL